MKYFGTDGIRDKADTIIKKQYGYYIGIGLSLFKEDDSPVFIARDTRLSGKTIVEDIKKGLSEVGIDAYDLGIFPTPVLAFFTRKYKTYGIMVTASHNPYTDNGIKIFNQAKKIDAKYELLIEDIIDGTRTVNKSKRLGKELHINHAFTEYYSLYKDFLNQTNMNISLDLANGAAVTTAEKIFSNISNHIHVYANNPDGLNINKDCGSTHLDFLSEKVKLNHSDLGIAFDGDADRLMVIDRDGDVIDGDLIIYIFAKYLKKSNQLKNNFVALSKMCNIGIIKALEELYIKVIQTDVGDKYIVKALEEHGGVLGGENSGHIINHLLFETGDGVLNAAFLIFVLNELNQDLTDIKKEVTYYPDRLENIKDIDKSLVKHPQVINLVNDIKDKLGEDGKVLVRASGTEPLIRISASAKTNEEVDKIITKIKTLIIKLSKEGWNYEKVCNYISSR